MHAVGHSNEFHGNRHHLYKKAGQQAESRYYSGQSYSTRDIDQLGYMPQEHYQQHSQFYAEEFSTGDEEFQEDSAQLTPPVEGDEDNMIEEDYLVPSLMRNGNFYLAPDFNNKLYQEGPNPSCGAFSTAKKCPAAYEDMHTPASSAMPMTPPSSSGSACLLFIFVEHPQDPAALDKLTLPFEDGLTVMDMIVRVASSKRFSVSDYKAYQFDFDTLYYRLLKPSMTLDQLRHNCLHLFIRNSPCVLEQATGNKEHHLYLTAKLPVLSQNRYRESDGGSMYDCISRKFWVPNTVAVIELLFFICDRHGLNWREWELWLWQRKKFGVTSSISEPLQLVQLRNLNKVIGYVSNNRDDLHSGYSTKNYEMNSMTILVLPKGITSQRTEELADILINDAKKKMKNSKVKKFFSRIFNLGKKRKEKPQRAISTFDITDTISPQTEDVSHFRSHHDLRTNHEESAKYIRSNAHSKPRPVSYHAAHYDHDNDDTPLQEEKYSPKVPLPRVNFNKRNRAPDPPDRITSRNSDKYSVAKVSQTSSNDVIEHVSAKKRQAPKPGLVTKISISAEPDEEEYEISDSRLQSLELSSIQEGTMDTSNKGQPKGTLKRPENIMENPVYVKTNFDAAVQETVEPSHCLVKTVEAKEYAVATSVNDTRHIVSVSVMSDDSDRITKLDFASDGSHSPSLAFPSVTKIPVFESPPTSASVKVDTDSSMSLVNSPGSSQSSQFYERDEELKLSTPESLSSYNRDTSPDPAATSSVTTPSSKVLPSQEVLSTSQSSSMNTSSMNTSGREVVKIRSGYDISSVARRTKVIGGGKVKDTASRLSEATIMSGLRQLTKAANGGQNTFNSSEDMSLVGETRVSVLKKSNGNVAGVAIERVEISSKAETPKASETAEPKTSTPLSQQEEPPKENMSQVEEIRLALTKRASLYTPRPFMASSSSSSTTTKAKTTMVTKSGDPPYAQVDSVTVSESKPKREFTKHLSAEQERLQQNLPPRNIPPPPPPPPPLPNSSNPVKATKTATADVSLSNTTLSVEASNISIKSIKSIKSPAISMNTSSTNVAPALNVVKHNNLRKPRQLAAREESPREQMLNAIRDSETFARLRKVPVEQKRYVSVVNTYITEESGSK